VSELKGSETILTACLKMGPRCWASLSRSKLRLELLELRHIQAGPTSRESGDDRPQPAAVGWRATCPSSGWPTSTGATPTQIALAWLLARYDRMLLIPGTISLGHLEENIAATELELDDPDLAVLDRVGHRDSGAK
jgi:aryl-alcohol dehydrogenase-like predicted oxidoreductase